MSNYSLKICTSPKEFELVKQLIEDYMEWLGMDLCFQNIEKEFSEFENMYGYPEGCFFYILHNGKLVGGAGIRKFTADVCEMKRLFVYEKHRGHGYGKLLCNELVEKAKCLGYKSMVLDTVTRLKSANTLYESMGFVDIPSYYDNPEETVRYMGIDL